MITRAVVHRTPTIQDGLVIRWNPDPENYRAGEVSASRNGILISGFWDVWRTRDEIAAFNALIEQAWAAHLMLKAGAEPARYALEIDVRFGESVGEAYSRARVVG